MYSTYNPISYEHVHFGCPVVKSTLEYVSYHSNMDVRMIVVLESDKSTLGGLWHIKFDIALTFYMVVRDERRGF